MSVRLSDKELREINFMVAERLALRARVKSLEADIPLKWQARQDEMQATIEALRARVAQLEAALKFYAEDCGSYARAALKDAPE